MQKEMILKNEITINAPASKVWDVLVNPEHTKRYMYGCETVSDWKPGSSLQWKALYEGNEMVFVTGNIITIEPDRLLVYTTFDPHSGIEDIPGNHATVTYKLSEENGQTTLLVTQGDFANLPDGEKRYNDAMEAGGWQSLLVQMKAQAEE